MQKKINKRYSNFLYSMITNDTWLSIFEKFMNEKTVNGTYGEAICFQYAFHPYRDQMMSQFKSVFDLKKAAALYFWYKEANPLDKSICEHFSEYKRCIDVAHPVFNSNYGVYAYREQGLDKCVHELLERQSSRQAMFCLNTNQAMSYLSIDKLCTNTIQFFVRGNKLQMLVQMRSSDMMKLLPYDAFTFSMFFAYVYTNLRQVYHDLEVGMVNVQVASIHLYSPDVLKKSIDANVSEKYEFSTLTNLEPSDNNYLLEIEKILLNALRYG